MRKLFLAALLSAAFASPAWAGDKETIQALDDALAGAVNRGDSAAIAAMYAPGARMLPPDNVIYQGEGIAEFWKGTAAAITNMRLEVVAADRIAPDYIREISRVMFDTKGDKPTHASATAVVVWKLVDGKWMLWTDIFH